MNREDLDTFSAPVVNLYTDLENELMKNIAKELGENRDFIEQDPIAWKVQQLQNLGLLNKKNLETLRKRLRVNNGDINAILYAAGLEGLDQSEAAIEEALKKGASLSIPTVIARSTALFRILKSYEGQAVNKLNLTNTNMLNNADQVYKNILNRVTLDAMSGTMTGEQALRKAIRQFSEEGIPALVTKTGQKRSIEGYVRSVINTTANNVVNEMQDKRMEEYGIELVEITSHAGNRPGCRPYAGRIFSLKPNHPKYPYLYDPAVGRIGAADSLFGVNCGHYKMPFVEGISQQTHFPNKEEDDKKVYNASQKQRQIEREIRKAKTQKEMMVAAGDKEGAKQADKLIKTRQAKMRKFIDESGRTRRSAREQIGGGNAPKGGDGNVRRDSPNPTVPSTKGSAPIPKPIPKTDPTPAKIETDDLPKGSIVEIKHNGKVQSVQVNVEGKSKLFVELRDGTEIEINKKDIMRINMKADRPTTKAAPKGIRKADVPKVGTKPNTAIKPDTSAPIQPKSNAVKNTIASMDSTKATNKGLKRVPEPMTKPKPLPIVDNVIKTVVDEAKYGYMTSSKDVDKFHKLGIAIDDALNRDDSFAIGRYVGTSNSWRLNEMLYTGQYDLLKNGALEMTEKLEDNIEIIDNLSKIIRRNQIPENIRGLRMVDTNFLNGVLDSMGVKTWDFEQYDDNTLFMKDITSALTGVRYKNKSFTSLSYNPDNNVFKDKPIRMELLIDKGQPGLITDNLEESEIILDKNTEFEFIRFEEVIEETILGDEIRFLKMIVKVVKP